MNPYLHLLLEREFLVVAFSAIAAFATVITLGLPYLAGDRLAARMKAVSGRREELRQKQFEVLAQKATKGQLRTQSGGLMKQVVDRFDLRKLLESPGMKEKLARAGYRGQGPFFAFLFFRFAMPPMVLLFASIFVFGIAKVSWPLTAKLVAVVASALIGYYLPDVFLSNRIQKRMDSIMRAFPDALDLLLICVESGMSIEAAFNRVSQEVGTQSRRTGRGTGADHRGTVLSSEPPAGLPKSCKPVRTSGRKIRGSGADPIGKIRYPGGTGSACNRTGKP